MDKHLTFEEWDALLEADKVTPEQIPVLLRDWHKERTTHKSLLDRAYELISDTMMDIGDNTSYQEAQDLHGELRAAIDKIT